MTSRFPNRIAGLLVAAVVLCLTPAVSFATVAQGGLQPNDGKHGVLPINSHPYGESYGEWSAEWWQWIFSFTNAANPNFTNGNVDCSYGQSRHDKSNQVWFLAGNFGGTTVRNCTVPTGTALFIPVLNQEVDNVGCCTPTDPPTNFGVVQLKQIAAQFMDNPIAIHASIDGVDVPALAYRAQSPLFTVGLPKVDNLYQSFGLSVPGLNWPYVDHHGNPVIPAVSDGYWLMLNPLQPGRHTIKFGGTGNSGFALDVTYNIKVVPGRD